MHSYESVMPVVASHLRAAGGTLRISHLLTDIRGMGHDWKIATLMQMHMDGYIDLSMSKRTVTLL